MANRNCRILLAIGCLLLALSAQAQPSSGSTAVYDIDEDNTILRVYVGRAGVLARMGHNHVMVSKELSGQINLAPDRMASTANFSFPVSSLVVDDPAERERAGDGFDSQPGDSAIEGTRENMLGEGVLNAEIFPLVSASITPISIAENQWTFAIALDFQGNTVNLEIPGEVNLAETGLNISARFTLDHEDIRLSPFTALGGSLRVAEEIEFELLVTDANPN